MLVSEPQGVGKSAIAATEQNLKEAHSQLEYQFQIAKMQREVDRTRAQLDHFEVLDGMHQVRGKEVDGTDIESEMEIFDDSGIMDMSVPDLTDVCNVETTMCEIPSFTEMTSCGPLPLETKGSGEVNGIGDEEIRQLASEEMMDNFSFLTEAKRDRRHADEIAAEDSAIKRRFAAQKERTNSEGEDKQDTKHPSSPTTGSPNYGEFYARKRLLLKDTTDSKKAENMSKEA